ncbi:hypothetical protein FACS1894139_09590 [Planctomycetales bacterium]|nr:hypothetical protein FACS1894107_00670 [Planctomycetales bacterium]GHT05562.1 hypothetical protein FACS1894139_09590 [Planctomycetales bacterium]
MEMTKISAAENATILALDGKLDMSGVNQIDTSFKEEAALSNNVIVRMQKVSFLASMAMRMLMVAAKTLEKKNGKLILVGAGEEVESALRMAGLDLRIPLVADDEAALEQLKINN